MVPRGQSDEGEKWPLVAASTCGSQLRWRMGLNPACRESVLQGGENETAGKTPLRGS